MKSILSKLSKTTTKSKKRIGRGYGSKKGGHTTIRGAKGRKARGKVKLTFDGTKIKKGWIKRLPFLRGKGRLKGLQKRTTIFSLEQLHKWFKDGDLIDIKALSQASKIPESILRKTGVKILSSKEKITKSFVFKEISFSKTAKDQLVKTGAKIN
ncbi:uL15 family ribosomal protein [Patescibacteria group bacterium]|nr:uL15 family ribosomal protein [Patescibacteria group bacterium]MCG2702435.1 uL15 family ribosomal protein [Candidatus Parcubacteria bacterium]MBU4210325.1 uL15 family ribosomal protein [Patescibacteria group bacterium]MBU4264515.1 uL15 family ribosomal protein [Patescibacteria group bacterium]MBU4390446.1 uL15 family ribosomal protein [Patescibacteria group bacterium]